MAKKSRRRSGAQPGNQNARKHGFYSKVCTLGPRDALPPSAALKEMDHDIAIARFKLKALLAKDPNNFKLAGYLLSLRNRLINTRQLLMDRERRAKLRRSSRARRETSPSQTAPI